MSRIPHLPIEEYASDRIPGAPGPCLNSSLANRLLDRSEFHAWWKHPALNPEHQAEPPSDLMNRGSAAHAILLEDASHRIDSIPYDDWRTAAAKELRDRSLAAGRIPLLARDAEAAQIMAQRADIALHTSPDLDGLGDTWNESTFWWLETRVNTAGLERDCYLKCRPDMVSTDGTTIISYKTTTMPAHPDAYLSTLLRAGHDVQAAFEIAGVEAVSGSQVTHYVWLVQELEPPYACSLIGMDQKLRAYALGRYDQAVMRWAECLADDRWPSYPNRVCYPELPSWRLRELEAMEA